MDRWTGQEDAVHCIQWHTCIQYTVAYYSAIKKNGLMPFEATWIKLEIIILSEGSQKRKLERQITHDITYTWNLKYDTNEQLQNRKSIKAIGDRLGVTKGEEAGEGRARSLRVASADIQDGYTRSCCTVKGN